MPQLPDAPTGPNVDVNDDDKHIVKLLDLDEQPSKFRDQRKDAMSLTWKFSLRNQRTGEVVIDQNQNLDWEFWQWSPDTTFKNAKSGKIAKAREWTEALIGRELTDDELGDIIRTGFRDALVGKQAVADVEWFTTDQGIQRLRIIRLRPFKATSTTSSPPVVQFTTNGDEVGETREERRARLQRELDAA